MTDATPNYGLTRVGQDESLSKNGYSALDGDRLTLDSLLHALEYHSHDALNRLDNPSTVPTVSTSTTGGLLPSSTTYYYKVSLVDRWGLETAASPEVSITTPAAIPVGDAPAVNQYPTGGTLGAGQYTYVYTYETADGGETTASASSSIRVLSGSSNRIKLTLPDLPATVTNANIYRSKPGQSQFYLIGDTDIAEFEDTGLVENYTITPPTTNTTSSTNSVTVSLEAWPSGALDGVAAWRIYRATTSGGYVDRSLVHHVVETVSDTSSELMKSWVDTGDEILPGVPRLVSATMSGGSVIDLNSIIGALPLSAIPRGSRNMTFGGQVSGTLFDGSSDFPSIHLPYDIQPVAFTLAATGVSGRDSDPITVTLASTGGASTVALAVDDNSGLYQATWPLTDVVTIQGEAATRSAASVLAITDAAAASGMAVELDASGEYVQEEIELEPGTWTATVRCRFSGSTGSDLRLSMWEKNGPSTAIDPLDSADFQAGAGASTTTYSTVTPSFQVTTTTKQTYVVRLAKATSSATANVIDYIRIQTAVPTLPAGELSIQHPAPGGGSMGTYHQYTVWF